MPEEPSCRSSRRYANWLEVSFSAEDFVLDFGQQFDDANVVPHTGIVATPGALESFVEILTRSLTEHRRRYGADGRREP